MTDKNVPNSGIPRTSYRSVLEDKAYDVEAKQGIPVFAPNTTKFDMREDQMSSGRFLTDVPPTKFSEDSSSLRTLAVGSYSLLAKEVLTYLKENDLLAPILQEYSTRRFLLQKATELNLEVSASELDQRLANSRVAVGLKSDEEFRSWLDARGYTVEGILRGIKDSLKLEKLRNAVSISEIQRLSIGPQPTYEKIHHFSIFFDSLELANFVANQFRERSITPNLDQSLQSSTREEIANEFGVEPSSIVSKSVLGPIASGEGFKVMLVGKIETVSLDLEAIDSIRDRIFRKWISENADIPIDQDLMKLLAIT